MSDFKKAVSELVEKYFPSEKDDKDDKDVKIAKSIDVEKKLFTAVVLRPNEVDAQGDVYDEDTVEKACHDFSQFCRKANLQHLVGVEDISFVESWIAKEDMTLGEGQILKGDWVATAKINNEEVWKMCKDEKFTGFSVGCLANTEKIDE
jgi:hypothetical protein